MLRPALLAVFFASLTAPSLETPSYAPAGGTLRRTVALEHELGFESMSVIMGGAEVPSEYLPELDLYFEGTLDLVLLDRIEGVAGGRPTELVRSFDAVDAHESARVIVAGTSEDENDSDGTSDLVGRAVRFVWNEEEQQFDASFEEDGDEALLEGLVEDMDLRVLLPDGDMEPGDSWDVEGAACRFFLSPGGDLSMEWENPGGWDRAEEEELTGALEVRWDEVDDGVAVLVVDGTLETEFTRATNLDHVPVADGSATKNTRTEYAVEGRVNWSLVDGRLIDASFSAEVNVVSRTVRDEGQGGVDYEDVVRLSGSRTLVIEAGAAE